MERVITGRQLVAGQGAGHLLVSSEPLSFWGGYDAATGTIIDRRHPLSGQSALGRVLAVPETRGSSTSTAVLLEAMRRETAPAAIVTNGADMFIALAAIVGEELYGKALAVIALDASDFDQLVTDTPVTVPGDGTLRLEPRLPGRRLG